MKSISQNDQFRVSLYSCVSTSDLSTFIILYEISTAQDFFYLNHQFRASRFSCVRPPTKGVASQHKFQASSTLTK